VNGGFKIMTQQPKSLDDHIRCLARLTGAPGSFVEQVRALFTSKGIPLHTDAEPFLTALEEAFRREENIRASSVRAKEQMAKLRDNFRKVGQAYVDQLSQLRRLQSSLQQQSRRLQKKSPRKKQRSTQIGVTGNHRSLVTRTEREQLPMVPGPKEPQ
jgi:hypothetical protein